MHIEVIPFSFAYPYVYSIVMGDAHFYAVSVEKVKQLLLSLNYLQFYQVKSDDNEFVDGNGCHSIGVELGI